MSNRLFQSIIHQMKDAVDRVIGVIDDNGTVIACSELVRIGETREHVIPELSYTAGTVVIDNWTYRAIGSKAKLEYAIFVEGGDKAAYNYSGLLSVALNSIKQFYDEKYDRGNFIKNIILENILPGDIYVKAKELHFASEASRVVMLIRLVDKIDVAVLDIVQNLYPEKNRDFVINISESDIALVREVKPNIDSRELEKIAKTIEDTINAEAYIKTVIGIGSVVGNIKDLARSFKEAQIALEVGKVFDTEKTIINYENLGIGRLIYQLPTTLCDMFLREVFKKGSIESLDYETLYTIQKFFENNLNVSETSRKLFVHRNTLVYRLEKIKKLTGLDVREFDDAIIFKVALMVKKYLVSNPVKF